jgi:class I lanthipeptide synthase
VQGRAEPNVRSPWAAVLPAPTRRAAVGVARDVVARCLDQERVSIALAAARKQTRYPQSVYWEPQGIAQGDAGLALLAGSAASAFPEEGWDVIAHERLSVALARAQTAPRLSEGLFGGLAGLLFTTWYLSRDATRYRRALAGVEGAMVPAALRLADRLNRLPPGSSVATFDAISGVAGIAAALLVRREQPGVRDALDAVLRSLVDLVEDHPGELPRWYTAPEQMGDEATSRMYPNGYLNCGLAHGIPGPLAVMALARLEGVEVPGLFEAVQQLGQWLAEHRADDAWGINWPTALALGSERPDVPSRAAWCYGAPGVARSLWLAGEAAGDDALRALAVEGMQAVYRRPIAERAIDSPTFCHGVAGLLQVTVRFAHDTGLPVFAEAAAALTAQLLDAYEPDRVLGYASLEPGDNPVDQPGVLDGAPGVALALLAASTDAEPTWDRVFLLS